MKVVMFKMDKKEPCWGCGKKTYLALLGEFGMEIVCDRCSESHGDREVRRERLRVRGQSWFRSMIDSVLGSKEV